jgi:hypothetical protein
MANNTLAYGFIGLEALLGARVTTVGVQRIFDAVAQSAQEHTRQTNELLSSLVQRTTNYQARYELPGTGTLQPLDQWGNPLPVKPGASYTVSLPIQGGGDAWGDNRVTRALMTVEEANRYTLDTMRRDSDWVRRHVLSALFTNTTWTFADPQYGNLTIQPLANSDTVQYVGWGGSSAMANHYAAQAAAIADATNPYLTIRDTLMTYPSNRGPIVAYIPANLRATTEALASFVAVTDPAIQLGMDSDQIRGGVIDQGFGDQVLGFVKGANVWVVEWRAMPDSYILAHARGTGPAVGMREYPAPELQGFFPENFSADGNTAEHRMIRYAGFGVLNRVAAMAVRIGNASYAIPSGFTAPLAV